MKPKKKTKAMLTREYKICLLGMSQAIQDAQVHEKEVEEIERKIFDIMTSNVGMELSRLQVRLAEIKPKYESSLRMAGRCAVGIAESPLCPKRKKK